MLKDLQEEGADALAALPPRTAQDQHGLIEVTSSMPLREWLKGRNSSNYPSKVLRLKCISECFVLGQSSCGCPWIPGSVPGQAGRGLEQPGTVKGVPAYGRGWP